MVLVECTSLCRDPTLLVTKISRSFQDTRSIFQDPVACQQCLDIKTNSSYYGVWAEPRPPGRQLFFSYIQIKSKPTFHKFWHLHQHHCVRLPHHSLENSRNFQDLSLKIPGLSRTNPIFQDFPGPGNFTKRNPGFSRTFQEAWEPWQHQNTQNMTVYYLFSEPVTYWQASA